LAFGVSIVEYETDKRISTDYISFGVTIQSTYVTSGLLLKNEWANELKCDGGYS
jgi:sulfatase maturation enzyme AslB (radical SAM superfamily)